MVKVVQTPTSVTTSTSLPSNFAQLYCGTSQRSHLLLFFFRQSFLLLFFLLCPADPRSAPQHGERSIPVARLDASADILLVLLSRGANLAQVWGGHRLAGRHARCKVHAEEGLAQGHSQCRRCKGMRDHHHSGGTHGFETAVELAVGRNACKLHPVFH